MHVGHAIFVLVLSVQHICYMTVCMVLCEKKKRKKELYYVTDCERNIN